MGLLAELLGFNSSNGLRYDTTAGVYTCIWKTESSWAGQCRRLILRFADGIGHAALFGFR